MLELWFAAARGPGSPEFIEFDALGVKSIGPWVGEVQHDMRDPPGL
jgi:hypothetical protein